MLPDWWGLFLPSGCVMNSSASWMASSLRPACAPSICSVPSIRSSRNFRLKGVEQPPRTSMMSGSIRWQWSATWSAIFTALSPDYNPETASDLLNGMLVLRIGRYRRQIGEIFAAPLSADRSLRSLLFLAALYHDVAKPLTKKADDEGQLRFWDHDQQGAEIAASRGRALALSNDETARLETVVRNHMRILFHTNRLVREGKPLSRRAVYRFFRDAGPAGVDVCLLALADLRATYEQTLPQGTWAAALDVVRTMLENWFEKPAESIDPLPLLNGDDLMHALNLQPGKIIGELLEALREAQAMGEVTTREQALQMAREIIRGVEVVMTSSRLFKKFGSIIRCSENYMNIIVFDLETQNLFEDVGGRSNIGCAQSLLRSHLVFGPE